MSYIYFLRQHRRAVGILASVVVFTAALLIMQGVWQPAIVLSADTAPTVSSTTPANAAVGVSRDAVIQIVFSEDVAVTPGWFTLECDLSGKHIFEELDVTGGPQTWAVDSQRNFNAGDTCLGTVVAANITDLDVDDPPNTMNANYTFSFETVFENIPPYFNPLGDQVGTELQLLTLTVQAIDPNPSETITYSLTTAPTGAKINPTSGVFSWAPSGSQGGASYPVTITATDSASASGSISFAIQVNDVGTDLVTNGAFEAKDAVNPTLPATWKSVNLTGDSLKCNKPAKPNIAFEGDCAFQFKGGIGENSRLVQKLPVNGLTATDKLILTSRIFGKNTAVGGTLKVKIKYVDGTSDALVIAVPNGTMASYTNINNSLVLDASVQTAKLQIGYTGTSGKFLLDLVGVIWQDSGVAPTPTLIPTSTPLPPPETTGKTIASSRMTGETFLFAPGIGIGNITIQCRLTIDDASKMTEECWYSNLDNTAKHVVYCDMGDLQAAYQSPFGAPPSAPEFRLQDVNDLLTCTPLGFNGSTESSIHFACVDVALDPMEQRQKHVFTNNTTYIPWSDFDVAAWQFQVNYADVWNILPTSIKGYDAASCASLISQGGWLVPDATPESAYWVVSAFPFDDPFVVFQPINTRGWAGQPQYASFTQMPCAPQGLNAAALAPCPINAGEAPPMTTDINLFYWESHMPPPTNTRSLFPTRMSVESSVDLAALGIRTEVSPKPGELFNIAASKEGHGKLTLCDARVTDRCVVPDVPEGTKVTIRNNFFNAEQADARFSDADFANQTQWVVSNRQSYTEAETERWIFAQEGMFIKDTQPPVVQGHNARIENGELVLDVTAFDTTTQPTFVNVWYSVDGGITWEQQILDPTLDFTTELQTRTFAGRIALNGASSAQFMIGVQDMVYNWVYYGIGTAQ